MNWRARFAIILSLLGGLGPAVVLLFTYGPHATLGSANTHSPDLALLFVGLMLGSLICGVGAASLVRASMRGQIRSILNAMSQMGRRAAA